jgi:acyl-CoA dehydrogenase
MSLSIARLVDEGGSPVAEAAMAKDLGTEFEQHLVDQLWPYRDVPVEPGPARDRFVEFLDINRFRSPVFTTAGGTNEVLRLLVGRQLGGWAASRRAWALASDAGAAAHDQATAVYDGAPGRSVPRGESDRISAELTRNLRRDGFLGVSVPEELHGAGGTLADALEIVRAVSYAGVSTPVVEGPVLAGWLLARAGIALDWSSELAVIAQGDVRADVAGDQAFLTGTLRDARWAPAADVLVIPVVHDGAVYVATVGTAGLEPAAVDFGASTAGEPLARAITLAATPARDFAALPVEPGLVAHVLEHRAALGTAVRLAAALQRVAELTIEYAATRSQFGQPIARFQAVQTYLARLASQAQRAAVLADAALAAAGAADGDARAAEVAACARVLTGEAAIVAARLAHQVHGAIGFSMEYPLQRYSRRLWDWSAADGSTAAWAAAIGARAVRSELGAWEVVTAAG